jgi:uncharacterized protein YebE (UPF0316 family)
MFKFIIIFIAGIVETYLYTWWCLSANKKQKYLSSILMFVYMVLYLGIINYCIKDINSGLMLTIYAISCGLGNYLRIRQEK